MPFIIWILMALAAIAIIRAILRTGSSRVPQGFNPRTTVKEDGEGYTYYRDYGGETRYLNGKPLKTANDLTEWQAIMGHGKKLYGRLMGLERIIGGGDEQAAADALSQWEELLCEYRAYVLKHGLYHDYVGDRKPYTGAPEQIRAEKEAQHRVHQAYKAGKAERQALQAAKDAIYNYIQSHKGEDRRKTAMTRTLYPAVGDAARAYYLKAYRALIAEGTIREITRQNKGQYVQLCSKPKVTKGMDEPEVSLDTFAKLTHSQYRPTLYENLDFKMLCKARHDVGEPQNLDRWLHTCTFVSTSTGQIYRTSLEACTCPAFERGISPCKHMVKLKITLYGE